MVHMSRRQSATVKQLREKMDLKLNTIIHAKVPERKAPPVDEPVHGLGRRCNGPSRGLLGMFGMIGRFGSDSSVTESVE